MSYKKINFSFSVLQDFTKAHFPILIFCPSIPFRDPDKNMTPIALNTRNLSKEQYDYYAVIPNVTFIASAYDQGGEMNTDQTFEETTTYTLFNGKCKIFESINETMEVRYKFFMTH